MPILQGEIAMPAQDKYANFGPLAAHYAVKLVNDSFKK